MDPVTKLALEEMKKQFVDEMKKQFHDLDTKWEKRLDEAEVKKDEQIRGLESSLDRASAGFNSWQPQVDAAIKDLKLEVSKLNKHVDRLILERPTTDPGLLDKPKPAPARPSAETFADGPDGYRTQKHHQDHEFGFVFTHTHIPVKSMSLPKLSSPPSFQFPANSGFQYRIVYKKGSENNVADALSRHPSPPAQLLSISTATPDWLQSVTATYATDVKAQELLQHLALQETVGHYSLHQGVIKCKNKIWLGANTDLQHHIFTALHDSAIAGHSGFPVTYVRIEQLFFWPHMKSMIKSWVISCHICAQAKPDRNRYPGLLQPLPIPDRA
ncbi:unnamed protein product [Urochloa humidicola]